MFRFAVCFALLAQAAVYANVAKRRVIDMGTYDLVCNQEPVEIGIVLDSSASINVGSIHNFKKGLLFLQKVLENFEIGDGPKDARVSIIPFARGIYTREAFNLDTYHTKEEVMDAIGKIKYMSGGRTDTNQGISYMDRVQMAPGKVRPGVEKMAIVLTDGDSWNKRATAAAAALARSHDIKVFAVGVGNVKEAELLRIAGNITRAMKARSYNELTQKVETLVQKTCIRRPKPTTTPPPPTACGEDHPGDINFVFSPADLGLDNTVWVTSFISHSVQAEDFEIGFRFGVTSGSCPEDAGFDLDTYLGDDAANDIAHRMLEYEEERMVKLLDHVGEKAFSQAAGGREDATDIAVLAVTEENFEGLQAEIDRLLQGGVKVFVVDPGHSGEVQYSGVTMIEGDDPFEAAQHFVGLICNQ